MKLLWRWGVGAGRAKDDKDSEGLEDQTYVYGYKSQPLLQAFTWTLIVATGGLLRLVFHWAPQLMLYATHVRTCLREAEKILIVEKYQKHVCYTVKPILVVDGNSKLRSSQEFPLEEVGGKLPPLTVHVGHGIFKEMPTIRMFIYKKLRYIWDDEKRQFKKLPGLDADISTATLHKQQCLTEVEMKLRRMLYGFNEIPVKVKSVLTLLFLEVLNPFYIFQLFSFCLWFADDYMYYAIAILIMSVFGIVMSIIQTRRNQRKLRETVHTVDNIVVLRGGIGKSETVTTNLLVPGDIIVVPPRGCIMHCDAVLLTGNCIVNESMLTGESVPVTKTQLPNRETEIYDSKEHARHTLFCGTQIIQTRYYGEEQVRALVIRTGFSTSKGNLVRSIMYPPPVDFRFEKDSYKFVELLAVVASFGFIYTIITKFQRGVSARDIAIEALDLITIVVPPALPAAMTVGRMYAQIRLKDKDIFCISPRSINVSGSVNCVCFDKTGTLTEDGLDMWGVVPVEESSFRTAIRNMLELQKGHFLYGMVTCHSLTLIDGKLSGDPLDLKMFESTEWTLEEPDIDDNSKFDLMYPTIVYSPSKDIEIGIVRQFPFSSNLQRMSVITKTIQNKEFIVYCKGSPEMIVSLSNPDSIPNNFENTLREYTDEGYRVLAVGYKVLTKLSYTKVQRLQRTEAEQNLTFLGLVVLENKLKPETRGIIKELQQANIVTIMVTGDNMLTAVSVARDCGIVPIGKRVLTVHCENSVAGQKPAITFTHHTKPVHISMSYNGDSSQATKSTSIGSLDTLRSAVTDSDFSPVQTPIRSNEGDYVFALTGATWALIRENHSDIISRILTRGVVFARMSPDQKQDLVQELQALGYYVAMCGDGANDCGALKAAHAGISLSDAESSVASPFTSRQPNISCVPLVIREGRAALTTSFGIFKYMAAYSLTQFISVMILYSIDTNLTDIEFLYIDLFIITIIAFFFGRTGSYSGELAKEPPLTSLVSFVPIVSIILQMLVVILAQTLVFVQVPNESWYFNYTIIQNSSEVKTHLGGYENYSVFSVSVFQYIILAIVFSKGKPYRAALYSNYGLIITIVLLVIFTAYLVLTPAFWFQQLFELIPPPDMTYRCIMLGYAAVHFCVALLIEEVIVNLLVSKNLRYKFHNVEKSKKKYLSVEDKLKKDPSWPVMAPNREEQCWTQNEKSDFRLTPTKLITESGSAVHNT